MLSGLDEVGQYRKPASASYKKISNIAGIDPSGILELEMGYREAIVESLRSSSKRSSSWSMDALPQRKQGAQRGLP